MIASPGMPHTTFRYGFESRVLGAMGRLVQPWVSLTGNSPTCLLIIDGDGSVTVKFSPRQVKSRESLDQKARLAETAAAYLFYDPFDVPEYEWLEWSNIDRGTMEALIGEQFVPGDFTPVRYAPGSSAGATSEESTEYPRTWGVMF